MALTYSYAGTQRAHDLGTVLSRIDEMKAAGASERANRDRIKAIMDGGAAGIKAVMAWEQGRQTTAGDLDAKLGVDLPAVNLMASGVERLAQRVGDMPYLRAPDAFEKQLRETFEKRRAIVGDWDEYQQLELQFPQIGRWLPGYTHTLWVICQGYYGYAATETPYPKVQLRDSYDVYCGYGQEPDDVMTQRRVPLRVLRAHYPDLPWDRAVAELKSSIAKRRVTEIPIVGKSRGPSTWEGENTGVEVVEYMNADGRSLIVPDLKWSLTFTENPIWPEPPFVVARRFSFSANVSAYHHVIGLVAMMAKLNILGLVASEDSAFREINIIGDIESGEYEVGRGAVNIFSMGSRVERPTGDQAQQLWAQIDRVERQLRIGAAYDVSNDGISPNSYATQAGIQELASGTERNVAEYQKIIRFATERLDARRLMWAERMWPTTEAKIYHFSSKDHKSYTPSKDIAGDYRTRRRSPVGSLFGTPQNIVASLQLLGAGVIDLETVQDAVPGLSSGEAILARNRKRKVEEMLTQRLFSMPPGQPIILDDVMKLMAEIMANPDDQEEIILKLLKDLESEMEAQAQAQPPGMPAIGPEAAGPPGVWDMLGGGPPTPGGPSGQTQTTLSRLMSNNTADAGVQLAGRLGG